MDHDASDWYALIASLPVRPQPPRSLSSDTTGSSRLNASSSLTRHAAANDGKYAHLLFSANFDAPSPRKLAVSRYLPA